MLRNGDADTAFSLPAGSFVDQPSLTLAPGGRALFLRYADAAAPNPERVAVLDTRKNWATAAPPTVLTLGQPLVGIGSDGSGHVLLAGATSAEVFDLGDALDKGKATPIGSAVTSTRPTLAAASDGKRLFSFYLAPNGADDRLRIFNLADGSQLIDQALPPSAESYAAPDPIYDSMVAAPGGRRVYWLTGLDFNRKLLTVVLDPETGAVVGEEPPIVMPGGARDLVVFPDGEGLVVLDARLDQMLLFR